MLLANWIHPLHRWHPRPRWLRPRLPRLSRHLRLPRLHLSHAEVATARTGAILVLCALLAGSLAVSLRGEIPGRFSPAATSDGPRA
jgi:hypothetical protein